MQRAQIPAQGHEREAQEETGAELGVQQHEGGMA